MRFAVITTFIIGITVLLGIGCTDGRVDKIQFDLDSLSAENEDLRQEVSNLQLENDALSNDISDVNDGSDSTKSKNNNTEIDVELEIEKCQNSESIDLTLEELNAEIKSLFEGYRNEYGKDPDSTASSQLLEEIISVHKSRAYKDCINSIGS